MTLTTDAFPAFFGAIHGVEPFPWQERLAQEVIGDKGWPDVLDLPTGVGKTAALDIAVFALAVNPLRAPRRTVFVVDRRIVVDQTHERAVLIARRLLEAKTGVLKTVRDRLVELSGNSDRPLAVAALRGGVPRDSGWARCPDQPLIAVSTVDQAGSRLLFRGYGVSDRMLPIHAGLLGEDTLFLLDEVHLSEPFAETLGFIQRYRASAKRVLPERWEVVRMSATPGESSGRTFSLASKEVEAGWPQKKRDRSHPVLQKRLEAPKPTKLCKRVDVGGGDEASRRRRLAQTCADATRELIAEGLTTTLVVVNRVDTARIAFALLEAQSTADVWLLTGRMRPLDKDDVAADLVKRIGAARTRTDGERPLIVVATQCIEAGADFDVDGLVTECASLDALRQRFGRLNRRGEARLCGARILIRGDQVKTSEDDPVYGPALATTWRWLEAQGPELDFGISALKPPEDAERAALRIPPRHAPILLPTHLDLWAQTNPRPYPDPEVGHWLHGAERQTADVQVVWRADLTEAALTAGEGLDELISACPPGSIEALPVPIYALRAWLDGQEVNEGSDVEGELRPEDDGQRRKRLAAGRLALRWSGDKSEVVSGDNIRPGDTVVVPSQYGGLLRGECWDPAATSPVRDLGDLVQWQQRGRPTLRLDARVLGPWLNGGVSVPEVADDPDIDPDEQIDACLEVLANSSAEWIRKVAGLLTKRRQRRVLILGAGDTRHYAVCSRRRWPPLDPLTEVEDVTTEDDASVFASVEVTLEQHSGDVERHARGFAERCGLPEALVADLALAGFLHDLGKSDPRFQRMLCGGSEAAASMLDAPLAKSGIPAGDARARARAQERSGYPRGTRHELMSVALLQGADALRARAADWELVLHLVASHHGWCRPFAPPLDDPEGPTVEHRLLDRARDLDLKLRASANHGLARLDSGIADRFWSLVRKYGRFGLAWLEAILRLADHRASAEEQEPDDRDGTSPRRRRS